MKKTLRTTVMLSLLIVGSLSLSAQKHLFIKDARLLISYTPVQWGRAELSTEQTSEAYRLNKEENLRLKDWMTDMESWQSTGTTELARATRLEEEAPVRLEEWMIQPGLSTRQSQMSLYELIRVEQEPPIKLQKWMICCADWMKASR